MLRELHFAAPGGWHVAIGMHPALTAVGVAVATLWARRRLPAGAAWSAPLAAVVVLAGSRALYWLVHGGAGLSSMGGVALGLAAALLVAAAAGLPLLLLLDAVLPPALLALGIGRAGCLLAGCCYGRASVLPWAVVFPSAGPEPRHPLQLYSAAADVLIAAAASGAPARGVATRRVLGGFAAARFALEWLRDVRTSDGVPGLGLTLAQLGCLVLLVLVAVLPRHRIGGLSVARAGASVASRMRLPILLVGALLAAAPPARAIVADGSGPRPRHVICSP